MPPVPELCQSQFCTLPSGTRLRYSIFEPSGTPQATVLVAPGRREFIEKKFFEMGREFLERNFRIIIFEWRGQGLSDRFLPGAARQKDHIHDFGLYLDDLDGFFAQIKEKVQGPLWLLGHSMGGHLFLRWAAERQTKGIRGAILTAPMLALGPRMAHGAALGAFRTVVELGFGEHYGPGQHNYGDSDRAFADNPLTHNAERFPIIATYFDAFPDLRVGGVTYTWLLAALKSMRGDKNANYLSECRLPILTITGERDRVTPAPENLKQLARLPNAVNVTLPGALHDLLNETEDLRRAAFAHIDSFLTKV